MAQVWPAWMVWDLLNALLVLLTLLTPALAVVGLAYVVVKWRKGGDDAEPSPETGRDSGAPSASGRRRPA